MKLYLWFEKMIAAVIGWAMPGRKTKRGEKVTTWMSSLMLLGLTGFVVNYLEVHAGINSLKTLGFVTVALLLAVAGIIRFAELVAPKPTDNLRRRITDLKA